MLCALGPRGRWEELREKMEENLEVFLRSRGPQSSFLSAHICHHTQGFSGW